MVGERIDVEFDRATLELVLKAFRCMRDTPGAVDWSTPTLSSSEKLRGWIEKLEALADAGDDPAFITMNYGEWGGYTNFVHYAHRVVPDADESDLLYKLYERYDEWDENDFKPDDPVIRTS